MEPTELTAELLNEFVDKIYVHESRWFEGKLLYGGCPKCRSFLFVFMSAGHNFVTSRASTSFDR